jgi:hypothetical protein
MRRVDPAFPDLLPVTHRIGGVPVAGGRVVLDPVEMRLHTAVRDGRYAARGHREPPRRPVRLLIHDAALVYEREYVQQLLDAGCGVVIVLDGGASGPLPKPLAPGQVVVVATRWPTMWGGAALESLEALRKLGLPVGVLLGLGPTVAGEQEAADMVAESARAGAEFVLAAPLFIPAEDRHRAYDALAGEDGDSVLEDLLFHTDLGEHSLQLERATTRSCRALGLAEGLPGPATAQSKLETFRAAALLLLWARRIDLMDGVESAGWQLRRAAKALLASGRDPAVLVVEDNLRIVPGFNPWVEAFARSLWSSAGDPFDEYLSRWLSV